MSTDNTPATTEGNTENTAPVENTSNEETTRDDEPGNPWEEAFPGKTPDDVLKETQDWKQHSREWEKRAKSWKKQIDNQQDDNDQVEELNAKVRETATRLDEVAAENSMFRDLIALEIESGEPVPISQLADSIAFRDAYMALDLSLIHI